MNRAERRKLGKTNSQTSVIQRYRDEAYREGIQKGTHQTIATVLYLTAYTINYKLGFGRKRLCRIMEQILTNIDCFRTGQLDPNDFKEIEKIVNNLGFKVR